MMLQFENIHSGYGPLEVLKGLSLNIAEGEIVTLLGANGAGKSTTLMTLCGVNPARSGRVLFQGVDITRMPPHEIVRQGIVQVPEGRRIFPRLTVRENLEMGAYIWPGGGRKTDWDEVFELFPILKDRQKQLGGTLSGGEQQMLAIGRAIMTRPKLLLLDEPSLGLAPIIVQKIFEIIKDINRRGTTIFLVEQNAQMALTTAHRGYVLQTGELVLSDTGANLLKSPEVRKAYLGG
jgi:branched-chain amino acid transport system ATP-binding protein